MPCECSRENTAAASVEPTIAPISSPWIRSSPSTQAAKAPVTAAVITTPSVASARAGLSPARKLCAFVRSPPSNRITARAMLPTI